MKKSIFLLLIIVIALAACKKNTTPAGNDTGESFSFKSLTTTDTLMKVNKVANIKAVATGAGLTFEWKATYGTFIGSGSDVQWTVCHADNFTITCTVRDSQGHQDAKSVVIRVQN